MKYLEQVAADNGCRLSFDDRKLEYTLELIIDPLWKMKISSLEVSQNSSDDQIRTLIIARAASLYNKYLEDTKNFRQNYYEKREVYFVGGPINGKTLNMPAGRTYAAAEEIRTSALYDPNKEISYESLCERYIYDLVKSHRGAKITWYGIGQEYDMDILAAFKAQTDLLKEIQDHVPLWKEQLNRNKNKPKATGYIQEYKEEKKQTGLKNLLKTCNEEKDPCPDDVPKKEESAWDKKLKEELERGDDIWGSIVKKYK